MQNYNSKINKIFSIGALFCGLILNNSYANTATDVDIALDSLAYTITAPEIDAQAHILIDYNTGTILSGTNYNQRQYPASLTKMMTSYVLGQEIKQNKIHPSDKVKISENAWGHKFPGSSKMFLNVGQEVTIDDLNHGIVIVSGNDACVAIAEHIAGDEKAFVNIMNSYTKHLGLNNTHFTTTHGLDDDQQYTTAFDIAKLSQALIRDLPEEYKIYAKKDFTFANITQRNRNGLLWDKSLNVDGLKTGHTNKAGYNLAASATQGNMRIISVVMGVPSYKGREVETKKILTWGFNNFETLISLKANTTFVESPVYFGSVNKVALGSIDDVYLTVAKNQKSAVKAKFVLNEKHLKAPLAAGSKVGKIIYHINNQEISSADLQVLHTVEEAGWFGKLADWISLLFKDLF